MLRDVQYFGVQTLREEAQHTGDQVLRESKLASDGVMRVRVRVAVHASKDCPPNLAHAGCPTHAEALNHQSSEAAP